MMPGHQVYGSMDAPTTQASVVKVDNGYQLTFVKAPPAPPRADMSGAVAEELVESEEEQIDAVVDGLAAFFRQIHGESDGGEWRGDGDREKVRKAFKAIQSRGGAGRRDYVPPTQPEVKQMVFETKAALFKFLEENL